ncbi:COP1-interacting protein-like protein [Quillaja saponaria]|uniref:COP1-interacting protein-like protein n=1 Tax=Quillaja saponaria TaxID=32244 RepID=A0AAD7PH63_QUISA|nr:COP1-interacting protein-like protein [Quillaja saponaria]
MNSSTRLDSAVFQLTPTRTRCDLFIIANGKKEKIASGLLDPFLSHLKTAQDQMAKGGYSIILELEHGIDAIWFTRGTVERFVRFVSTPEILERVYTIESEILQIEEAIAIQGNNSIGMNIVESQVKPVEKTEVSRPALDTNEEKAIVLYKPDAHSPEENGSTAPEENSKVELLKVLEARKSVLQKEQGMAFARAVPAGFEIEYIPPLMSFGDSFGASRLMVACKRFMELWKQKHETGQWIEIEADAMSSRSDFSALNASGTTLSNIASKPHSELVSENNGKASILTNADMPLDHQPPQGHVQGQFPHHMYPPWPVHSPPGALPVFQPYPVQGIPYYQSYPGNSPYFQPPYPPVDDPRQDASRRMGHKRHSMDSRDSNTESETWDVDALKSRSQDEVELETEGSKTQGCRKKASRSGKHKTGMVVIRNINYITSKSENSSGSGSQSESPSETDEGGDLPSTYLDSVQSSKRKGIYKESTNKLNLSDKQEVDYGKDGDAGAWEAFKKCLLRDDDEDRQDVHQSGFAMEKAVHMRRRQSTSAEDPLVSDERNVSEGQEGSMMDMHRISRGLNRILKTSIDDSLVSRREGQSDDGGSSEGGQMDVHSSEIDGKRGGSRRTTSDDFFINRQQNKLGNAYPSSDLLAVDGRDHFNNSLDRRSSHNMNDDSDIVPYRSIQINEIGNNERKAIDMDSEFPLAHQNAEKLSNEIRNQVNYEPDELSMMPKRVTEKGLMDYDPALDYDMQVQAESGALLDKKRKEVATDITQVCKKSDKDQKSKGIPNSSERKKTVGPIRRGKPSKLSPLDEARARAERLRNYKADLLKMKKEKKKKKKRLEALKEERQKRIAARGSSTSQQSKKQLPAKLSPISHRGSKFSDSEPGSSSPLQRFPSRTASMGSYDFQKASRPSKLNTGSHSPGNRISQSVSSLPEAKKEKGDGATDTKASMARIRRLSEPKMSSIHHNSSIKPRSTEAISKPKLRDGTESKKISAIMSLDKSKAATLPELKIRTSKGPDVGKSKSAAKEKIQKLNGNKSSITSEGASLKKNDDGISPLDDGDDNPVIEKTVVILEYEKSSVPAVDAREENSGVEKGKDDNYIFREKAEEVSDYVAICAPETPVTTGRVDIGTAESQSQQQSRFSEVVKADKADKESSKLSSIGSAEETYQAPFARVSSFEDPCTGNSEYSKAPPATLEVATSGLETVKAHLSDSRNSKLDKIPEAVERPQVKESSKGFKRLLKFGRKNHSSAAGESNMESDNISITGSEADRSGSNTHPSEVHTLKNLISQDETPTASTTPQKSSRSFSLLIPFRSKNSEKKLTS